MTVAGRYITRVSGTRCKRPFSSAPLAHEVIDYLQWRRTSFESILLTGENRGRSGKNDAPKHNKPPHNKKKLDSI